MYYIEVMVGGASYHGNEALTYTADSPLERGTIVVAPLRNTQNLGVVMGTVPKPSFKAKSILEIPDIPPLPECLIELMLWMKHYYPSSVGIAMQQFLPRQLPKKPVPVADAIADPVALLPELTKDQQYALKNIGSSGMHLLHGETGTGKTRVYIELARRAIANNKSAIILTPEIGLTSQLAHDFQTVFGGRVIVIHSQLTDVTRQRIWLSLLKQTSPVVIIGPRSALFSPLRDVGLIVVDESHETAYKQDQAPYYHASRVGSKLAALHHCPIILGSATPLVGDYFMAQVRERPILRMLETASTKDASKSRISVVDLKDRSKFTKK